MSWLAAPNFRLSEADRAECQARCSLNSVRMAGAAAWCSAPLELFTAVWPAPRQAA